MTPWHGQEDTPNGRNWCSWRGYSCSHPRSSKLRVLGLRSSFQAVVLTSEVGWRGKPSSKAEPSASMEGRKRLRLRIGTLIGRGIPSRLAQGRKEPGHFVDVDEVIRVIVPERTERQRGRLGVIRLVDDDQAAVPLDGPGSVGRVEVPAGEHDPDGSRPVGLRRRPEQRIRCRSCVATLVPIKVDEAGSKLHVVIRWRHIDPAWFNRLAVNRLNNLRIIGSLITIARSEAALEVWPKWVYRHSFPTTRAEHRWLIRSNLIEVSIGAPRPCSV
jgi:hypothetical protein